MLKGRRGKVARTGFACCKVVLVPHRAKMCADYAQDAAAKQSGNWRRSRWAVIRSGL